MLVIKVELWPHGRGGDHVRQLGQLVIANVGGTHELGTYQVCIGYPHEDPHFTLRQPTREGEVRGHKRLTASVWTLVAKALGAVELGGSDGE